MKTILYKALYKGSIMLFCLYGYVAHAQETCYDDFGVVVPCNPPPPQEDLPIDGNITILIFIAVLFGIYTIYKLNKKRTI